MVTFTWEQRRAFVGLIETADSALRTVRAIAPDEPDERIAALVDAIDLDGVIDGKVRFVGKARRVRGNTYRVLADVEGCLCVVEVTIGVDLARQP